MKCEINLGAGFVLGAITVILFSIFRKPTDPAGVDHVDFEFDFPDSLTKIKTGDFSFMAELKEGQSMNAKVNPKTRAGRPAAIEPGSATWSSSDESVVSVTQDPDDELKAKIEGVDGSENESVVVEFRADGKRGEGERPIVISGAVTCTQGDAVTGDMEFETPVDVEGEAAGGGSNGGGESQTIGSGDVGDASEVLGGSNPADGGLSSGAGGTANQGVDENPSAGAGAGEGASGTTAPSESDQPADQGGTVPTVQEAAADTAERNSDSIARQSDTA
jgi:hypothetical protein